MENKDKSSQMKCKVWQRVWNQIERNLLSVLKDRQVRVSTQTLPFVGIKSSQVQSNYM